MSFKLNHYDEPSLLFGYDQSLEDPRDGLTLFGPFDRGRQASLSIGVIGTATGIKRYIKWVKSIYGPLNDFPTKENRPTFPGFQSVFETEWLLDPTLTIEIEEAELTRRLFIDDGHKRVHGVVSLYSDAIIEATKDEDFKVDLWFVVVPDLVYALCRAKSVVPAESRIVTERNLDTRYAQNLRVAPELFGDINQEAIPYQWDVNFHNQLKARLLSKSILTQVVRETTIAPEDFIIAGLKRDRRNIINRRSEIAWNLCTSVYYKLGGRPWKISGIREGVSYIGLVFKRDEKFADPRTACCAAQMFLDSGDGVVFRGAVGPYYNPDKDQFHLKRAEAKSLIDLAMLTYSKNSKGVPPKELFIHGKVEFDNEEWGGFKSAVDSRTNLVGVKIRSDTGFRVYRKQDHPVLRNTAFIQSRRKAYLWTKGFIPRINTYPGREVPRPLSVELCRGEANIDTVLEDILALTKLNYNSCIYADGIPVTLRFANSVGEILTAGPLEDIPPLAFKHYV